MADTNSGRALSPGHSLNGERVRRIPPYAKFQIFDRITRVATWNVRSLYAAGKLANLDAEMHRLQIKILGLCEVRWPGSGTIRTEHGTLYYSGNDNPNHYNGVGVLVSSGIERSVVDFFPISDRLMVLKIKTSRRIMNIVQVYAPTSEKQDDMVEQFYNELEDIMKLTKKGELTIIIGDFNAKVGIGAEGDVVGGFRLGIRNLRGDRLVQFCTEQQLAIVNTFFKQPPRRLYTWRSPADCDEHLIRNQIDFILINKEHKKAVKSVKTYPVLT
ncbi:craniofacial development protein 2-like [Sitophilus oryzae]|uniref:Craniofacial development protein 2-like n=1 Tax=Sitophilus oryzae TaxID=7048 RepID=A0A6J2YA96_SITOR|nr:craniofacial development protein 2-like [Sitophilus oryzae]